MKNKIKYLLALMLVTIVGITFSLFVALTTLRGLEYFNINYSVIRAVVVLGSITYSGVMTNMVWINVKSRFSRTKKVW